MRRTFQNAYSFRTELHFMVQVTKRCMMKLHETTAITLKLMAKNNKQRKKNVTFFSITVNSITNEKCPLFQSILIKREAHNFFLILFAHLAGVTLLKMFSASHILVFDRCNSGEKFPYWEKDSERTIEPDPKTSELYELFFQKSF